MTSVQTVLSPDQFGDRHATDRAGLQATDLVAQLADGQNGITLVQNPGFGMAVSVTQANNSTAAAQLGLLNGQFNYGNNTFYGTDTATVRVDSLMSYLIDLRDALTSNSTSGIQLAAENIDRINGQISETRGMVGGYAQRSLLSQSRSKTTAPRLTEGSFRGLQDVDFTERPPASAFFRPSFRPASRQPPVCRASAFWIFSEAETPSGGLTTAGLGLDRQARPASAAGCFGDRTSPAKRPARSGFARPKFAGARRWKFARAGSERSTFQTTV